MVQLKSKLYHVEKSLNKRHLNFKCTIVGKKTHVQKHRTTDFLLQVVVRKQADEVKAIADDAQKDLDIAGDQAELGWKTDPKRSCPEIAKLV